MKIVLSIFYGLVLAIVAFIQATRIIRRLMEKRHARHLQKAKEYLAIRPSINRSITEKWADIEPNANWLKERIAGPADLFGKHAQAVTNTEIDDLIKECVAVSKVLKRTLRKEHSIFKRLSDSDREAWSLMEHSALHAIDSNLTHIKVEFKALRRNLTR